MNNRDKQAGVALVVALLFLLVVTILSVTAARNSSFSLQMSSNMQDANNSFQSAEAGIFAALALAGTGATDPFTGTSNDDPFDGISPSPLENLNDPNSVTTEITLTALDRSCPRPRRSNRQGSSEGTYACDYYRIDAEHDVDLRARTRVSLGVVKTVLASQ
ncbi:MAG: PilX N-terminal domain-containing pilus assembly protein [Halioglobus sp.]